MDQTTLPNSPPSASTGAEDAPESFNPQGRWVSVVQYQALYGFSKSTIWKAIHNGELRSKRKDNRTFLIWDTGSLIPSDDPLQSVAFIKATEVAEITGIPVRTIQWQMQNNIIKVQHIGDRYYTTIAELRKVIDRKANKNLHGPRKKHIRRAVIELVRQKLGKI